MSSIIIVTKSVTVSSVMIVSSRESEESGNKRTRTTAKSQIQRARKLIAEGFMECCGLTQNEKGHLVGEIKDKKDCKICGV